MSSKSSEIDESANIGITLMTLRKPTELKKVVDSVPKPSRAVPKNGLPLWYRLGLECKLPVPKIPEGKIIFSRGKIGEDVRRIGLGSGPNPTFDLTDPYCNNVSYDYVSMHDPHLANHFAQKPARNRMILLGYCTNDGRAVCSLKEFNQYRKYLYNQFMDRIHMEMKKLDERARDDLTLKRVEGDVARRQQIFRKSERAREHLERVAREQADEWAEKKRLAKEQEKKIRARMKYLAEFNEKQRKERALKSREKENRIKQRVQAAAEMELRRKITMIRLWRTNEKKRLNRLKQEREAKLKRLEEEANNKWKARVDAQNQKIQEEALLLKIYTEDMKSASTRRAKRAEVYAYNTDLELQRIRLANWKLMHGGTAKAAKLVRKMGIEFEKSKRGAKGMSRELAQRLASEAMASATSTQGDTLMTLGQARARMDMETVLPPAPIRLLDQILETSLVKFAQRRMNHLLRNIEQQIRADAALIFFLETRPASPTKGGKKTPRWSSQVPTDPLQHQHQGIEARSNSIAFGEVIKIQPDTTTDVELKSVKDRPPTPVPSKTTLAEVTFSDRVEDLPDPVAIPGHLPERKKLIEMMNTASRLMTRSVTNRVLNGMDLITKKVTLPRLRHSMEWNEAVEGLAVAALEGRVRADCAELRQASELLAYRVLHSLQQEMRDERLKKMRSSSDEPKDFYIPSQVTTTVGRLYEEVRELLASLGEERVHQLVQENTSFLSLRKPNMSMEASTHYPEVGQKRSSNASLLVMNPVASGDNMATDLNSSQKYKEELPPLVPCCEGKELQISEDIVRSGLSAISVKHDSVVQCLSTSCASGMTLVPHSVVKHRNSFRCLHRPDLKRVPYLRRLTPDELEMIFRGFADVPHRLITKSENLKMKIAPETSGGSKDLENAAALGQSEGIQLHPIPEIKSEDVPAGMRLHGARARLYTSVLAGTKTGDQLDNTTNEEEDMKITNDAVPEDEIQLNEELQIILPPRCDEVYVDSSLASSIIS